MTGPLQNTVVVSIRLDDAKTIDFESINNV